MQLTRRWFIPVRVLFVLVVLGFFGCDQPAADVRELTADQWRQDLAYLGEKLPDRHGNAFHEVSRADFERAVARLDEAIPRLAHHEVLAEMGRIVALVGDGHTELWLPQSEIGFRRLPVAVHYFGDELYVFATTEDHTDLLGRRVVAIGDVPIVEAYERVIPLIGRDNEYEYLRSAPIYLMFPAILNAVGITPSPDEAVLRLADGDDESTVTLHPIDRGTNEWINAREASGSPAPLYLRDSDRWYWYEYLPDSRTLYLRYDRCRNQPGQPSIKRFARELFEFVDEHPIARFVVDLRHNTGGNYHRNEPLIAGIERRTAINRRGALYVITGRTTFSAATMAAIHLESRTEAILVGEPSRGRPNGYSDEKHLRLPNSNVEVNYSPLYREAMPELGDAAYLPVDLAVERSFDDYRAGRDPVLDAILSHEVAAAPSR